MSASARERAASRAVDVRADGSSSSCARTNPRPLPNHQMFHFPRSVRYDWRSVRYDWRSVRYKTHHNYWLRLLQFLVAEWLQKQIGQRPLRGLRRRHDSHRSDPLFTFSCAAGRAYHAGCSPSDSRALACHFPYRSGRLRCHCLPRATARSSYRAQVGS